MTDHCPKCADAAAIRQAFYGAMDVLERRAMPDGCKEYDVDLDKMNMAQLRALLAKWQALWRRLYETVRDARAGLAQEVTP